MLEPNSDSGSNKLSVDKFRLIFDTAYDAIFVADVDTGILLDCNIAAENLVKRKKSEIINQHQSILHPPRVLIDGKSPTFKQHSIGLFEEIIEEQVITSEGNIKNVAIHGNIIEWDGRKVLYGVFRDVTEQKEWDKEREHLQAKIVHAAKLASIGTLAAGVAHEINNPLAIIAGNMSLLEGLIKQNKPIEAQLKLIEKQHHAVKRITTIVNQLRTYARADTPIVEKVNVNDIILETVGMVHSIFIKCGITIITTLAAKNNIVNANIGKLQQVIMNLLSNAKDALENHSAGAIIKVETLNNEESILVRVIDNGCGIPANCLSSVFDAFFTTKEPGKGTGLGLSISHSIIESFGGNISVESEVNVGTTFTIKLPISITQHVVEPPPSVLQNIKGKALIVDDEEDIREVLKDFLLEIGLTVDIAENGQQALEILRTQTFDYVISDLKMPKMNGDALMTKAKAIPHLAKTKFLIITGGIITNYTQEQRDTVRNVADAYLCKPFTKENVANALAKLK